MARHGRNLTAREKKQITMLSKSKVNPDDYVVIREISGNKINRTLHLRHKISGEEFEATIPR